MRRWENKSSYLSVLFPTGLNEGGTFKISTSWLLTRLQIEVMMCSCKPFCSAVSINPLCVCACVRACFKPLIQRHSHCFLLNATETKLPGSPSPGVVVGRWRPAHRDSLSHSPQPAGAAAFSSYIIWGYATLGRLLACDLSGQWWSASRYSSWRRRGRGGRAGRRKRRRCGLQTQEEIEPAVFVSWLITSFVGKTKPSLFPQTHTYPQ